MPSSSFLPPQKVFRFPKCPVCPFLLRDQQNACRQNRQAAKCDDGFFFEADVSNVFNGLTIAGDDFAVRTLMPSSFLCVMPLPFAR